MNTLNTMNKNDTRAINGGSWKCRVCGAKFSAYLKAYGHVAIRHVGEWSRNVYDILTNLW